MDKQGNYSFGKDIIRKMESPFVTKEIVANWIDLEIEKVKTRARIEEQIRIEEVIANMTDKEREEAVKLCKFYHGEPNKKELYKRYRNREEK